MTDINVLVLDNGSESIKASYCIPERDPLLVTPSAVKAGDGSTLRPIRRGVVQDWDALESIYHHIFYEQLGWTMGEEGCVLVAEPLFTSKPAREALVQLLFEQFNVAGLYVAEAPTLSLYAVGKLTGLAVDIGAGKIDICPVFEGCAQAHAGRRVEYGGTDLDAALQESLRASGVSVDEATAKALKEAHGFACETADAFAECLAAPTAEAFALPDGRSFSAPRHALARSGELLFDPRAASVPRPGAGLTEEILSSVQLCISDQRRQMLESVVLCGGGRGSKGLENRVLKELTAASASTIRPSLVQSPEYMPENTLRYAPFVGGAILAKTVFPQNHHISKHDYHEHGPAGKRT